MRHLNTDVSSKDKNVQISVVMRFLQCKIGIYFDTMTHTSTVGNLIRGVRAVSKYSIVDLTASRMCALIMVFVCLNFRFRMNFSFH